MGYIEPHTISQSDVQDIIVVLDSKPDYTKPNPENIPNISFKSVVYTNIFDISHCALDLINIDDIVNLNIGDTLNVLVDKRDLSESNKIITVCGITINGKRTILNLDDYNSCAKNGWKEIYFLGLTFALVLILIILWKIIKHIKNNG